MRLRTLLGASALVGTTVFISSAVFSSDKGTTTRPATQGQEKPEPGVDTESPIEMWVRYAMPAKHHRLLNQMAGSWDTVARYKMNPDSLPVESEGTCERKWVLDGRFLLEEFDGGDLALPFRGLALYGYDRFEQKYTSAWVDTMSTAIMTNLGTYDEPNKVVNFAGRYGNPWTGVKAKSRGVTRFVSNDRHVLELHVRAPDGREFKTLEIIYTRRPSEEEQKVPARRP